MIKDGLSINDITVTVSGKLVLSYILLRIFEVLQLTKMVVAKNTKVSHNMLPIHQTTVLVNR